MATDKDKIKRDPFKSPLQEKLDERAKIGRKFDTNEIEQFKTAYDTNKPDKERYNEKEVEKEKKKGLFQNILGLLSKNFSRSKNLSDREKQLEKEKKARGGYIQPDRFEGLSLQDIIAPIDMEVDFNHVQIADRYYRTFFVSGYPRFVGPNWLSPIINFEHSITISTFYYPIDSKTILNKLKKKIGELEATLYTQMEKRQAIDPSTKIALSDAQQLQDSIAQGAEKFFYYGMYIMVATRSKDLLDKISKNIISTLAAMNMTARTATLQQEDGLISCQPLGLDNLYITRNMDTTSIASTFPFVTSELTMDHGVMYGINQHNNSMVIFDRFDMENANTAVFAKSGAGKSYFVKLEAVRNAMFGTQIIIIDPEHEYERLCEAIGGTYISFSQDKSDKINPFEISGLGDPEDDELRSKILTLESFLRLMMGELNSNEIAVLDRALLMTYREKGITLDPQTQRGKKMPLLEDLYKVLKGMADPEARVMAGKLERYIIGSAAGIFNEETNVNMNNQFVVFSVRDLQEELRPMGMFLILDYIWTTIRKERRKRILIVDEAWYMMQNEDTSKFMYSLVKRARKYYLGVTTITQDVEDFLKNELGRAIINNSSIQFLMKQSPNAIDRIGKVFNLSEGEKAYLLNCDKGQGLFFAGQNHVAIQVVANQGEHYLITTDPRELADAALLEKWQNAPIDEQAQPFSQQVFQEKKDDESKKEVDLLRSTVAKRQHEIRQILDN